MVISGPRYSNILRKGVDHCGETINLRKGTLVCEYLELYLTIDNVIFIKWSSG